MPQFSIGFVYSKGCYAYYYWTSYCWGFYD